MTTPASWKAYGASVIGPAHSATAKPNQDAWLSFHHSWCDGIVVSDGLGSKSLSDYGSNAACRAVEHAVRLYAKSTIEGRRARLLSDIRNQWLASIAPLGATNSSATCLFAFRLGDGLMRMGALGDGCAAAVRLNGSVVALMDDKASGFSNVTKALSPNTQETDWTTLDVPESECEAIVLCTDGVSDDLDNVDGFMAGFVRACRGMAQVTASRQAYVMLENWPVPKHSDDKTIVCLRRTDSTDG